MSSPDRWDARIARARYLAGEHQAASEILTFYAELAGFQKEGGRSESLEAWKSESLEAGEAGRVEAGEAGRLEAGEAGRLEAWKPGSREFARMVFAVPDFLSFLTRVAPSRLAEAVAGMREVDMPEWHSLFERYWSADAHEVHDADEGMIFVVEALLQPFAEAAAIAHRGNGARGTAAVFPDAAEVRDGAPDLSRRSARCPICAGKPLVGVLREEGQSARRSLVCGLCFTEWAWPRIVCPACGEDVFEKLPVYRSEAFAGARVDACDSCRTYLKTIDLSKDALAIPIVDEIAAVPLDLWAREQGYTKLRPNLLRM
jgi:formate dehydrogenase maturation protein FdhE